MSNNPPSFTDPHDPTAETRKGDHIDLAFRSQSDKEMLDNRFEYEPMLASNALNKDISLKFLGKDLSAPIWMSSMTGGTQKASMINRNLAKACGKYKLGMGLGSCRSLLHSDDHLPDFDVRNLMGDQPLYANLGIAQIEQLIEQGQTSKIEELINKLSADGLIIHVNPLQELMQPEGDIYHRPPIELIKYIRDILKSRLIVKEVGQGYGPKSMQALVDIGVDAIDFAAYGGTNFATIELARASTAFRETHQPLANVGHTAADMVQYFNQLKNADNVAVIISGGVKTYLDGHYLTNLINANAVYGQASGFLKHAMVSYEGTCEYVESQIKGLKMAASLLTIKSMQ